MKIQNYLTTILSYRMLIVVSVLALLVFYHPVRVSGMSNPFSDHLYAIVADSDSVKQTEASTSDSVLNIPEPNMKELPKFRGGDDGLWRYLNKNLRYPAEAAQNRIVGKVTTRFKVDKTGKTTDVTIIQSVVAKCSISGEIIHPVTANDSLIIQNAGCQFDKEVIRIINEMPLWKPAISTEGTPMDLYYTLPVFFRPSIGN